MYTMQEAYDMVQKFHSDAVIKKVTILPKMYVFTTLPKGVSNEEMGNYVNNATYVEKETGKMGAFNPFIAGVSPDELRKAAENAIEF